jgi:hypothetical protein
MYDNSKTKYNKYFFLLDSYLLISEYKINSIKYLIDNIKYDKSKYIYVYKIFKYLESIIGDSTIDMIELLSNNIFNKKTHYDIIDNSKFKADIIYILFCNNFTYEYINDNNLFNINNKYYNKNIKKYNFIRLRVNNNHYNTNYYFFYLLIKNQSKGGNAILIIRLINKYTIDIIRILSKYYTYISIKNVNLSLKSNKIAIYLYNFKRISNKDLNYYYDILIKIHNHNLYIENLLNNNNLINDIIRLNKNIIKNRIVNYNNRHIITKVYLQSNKKLQAYIIDIILKKQIDIFFEYYLKYYYLFNK